MAIHVWRGDAQRVAQVVKVTVEAVEAGDSFSLTINSKTVEYTAQEASELDVYQGLASAIGDAAIPEYPSAEVVEATPSEEAHLRLTGNADGRPFSVTGNASHGGAGGAFTGVIQQGSPAGVNEIQRVNAVTSDGSSVGHQFTLSFQGDTTPTLGGIAPGVYETPSSIQSALEALPSIGAGNVEVRLFSSIPGDYAVEFVGDLAGAPQPMIEGSGGGLLSITRIQAGQGGGNEIVQLSIDDGVSGGTYTLSFGGDTTSGIAYNANAGAIETALEGLASIGNGNVEVTGTNPFFIEFIGALELTNVGPLTVDPDNLTGAATEAIHTTTVTNGTGPHHWDNGDNWDSGNVPANGDTVVFEHSPNSVLYGLDQSAVTLDLLVIRSSFSGTIGLPPENPLGFIEYLPQYLQIGADEVRIGEGGGPGSERIKIDLGAVESDVTVFSSSIPAAIGEYAVSLKGTHADNVLRIYQGSVAVAQYAGESAIFDTVQVGYVDDPAGDVELFFGDDVEIGDAEIHGGEVIVSGRSGHDISTLLVTAGEVTINGDDGVSQLDINGGTVNYRTAGTLGGNTVVGTNGTLSFEGDLRAKTVTNAITVKGDASNVVDPQQVVTSLVVAYESTTRMPEMGTNYTLTRS